MEQKQLSKWLKLILAGLAFCGILVYAVIIPACGVSLRTAYPEFSDRFWPWLFFLWATAVPCLIVLGLSWKIAANIGNDRSFTEQNARLLKWISYLAAGDAGFFFAGNVLLLFLNMTHFSVLLASVFILFVGIAIAVAAAALSYLVKKAAVLQEESDLTI